MPLGATGRAARAAPARTAARVRLNFALVVVAVVVADVLSVVIGKHSSLWIPGADA